MKLGEVIRKWRRVEGKSTRQVAQEIGISTSVLNRIESGGQGEGKQKGSVEMNGQTLGKILVWLLNGDDTVAALPKRAAKSKAAAAAVLALVTILLLGYLSPSHAQASPFQVGDLLIGTCDSPTMDTELGATEVIDDTGNGVFELDAGVRLNLCMEQMTVDSGGNTYVQSDQAGIFVFDNQGNRVHIFRSPVKVGMAPDMAFGPVRLPTLSSIIHDQSGTFYYVIDNGVHLQALTADGQQHTVAALPGGGLRFGLMSDQHTLVYVAMDTGNVRSFDLITGQVITDIVTAGTARVPVVLPDGSLIVLDRQGQVTHWAAPCPGCTPYQQIAGYTLPSVIDNIAADPDGVSFRAIHVWFDDNNQSANGMVYRVGVGSGQLTGTIDISGLDYNRYFSSSLAVYGDGMNSQAKAAKVVRFGKYPIPLGSTVTKSIAVSNTGPVQIWVSAVDIWSDDGQGEFQISKNQCQKGIRPGSHCNLWVTYTATRVGTQTGTVEVYGNVPGGKQAVQLTGTGK